MSENRLRHPAAVTMFLGTGAFSSKTLLSVALLRYLSNHGVDAVPYKAVTVLRDRDIRQSPAMDLGLPHHILAARVGADPRQCPVVVRQTGPCQGDLHLRGERLANVAVPCKDTVDLASLPPGTRDNIVAAAHSAAEHLVSTHRHVVVEGAGSAIVLSADQDLPNIAVARRLRPAIVLVSEFSGGGAAAALIGTFQCLPADVQTMVRGYVVANTHESSALHRTMTLVTRTSGIRPLGIIPANDELAYSDLYTDSAIDGWAARLHENVDMEALLESSLAGAPIAE
ncbi:MULTISPECIES: AAA family ATPase [unclassified Streptomyces]|uniref:AAA family ATPase n=1 Tax=unclassified Streptomyces TaxID=2593676 RepID=UPI002366DF31|nr:MULTISPECIES: AAA family ATPase [unclassified Streptomyces]MDF3139849.1 AAA family ATPase [Streptomyces sp. T21Q-yed]WDF41907.1 AAA family ATPase [Streptomyces sp. T12]